MRHIILASLLLCSPPLLAVDLVGSATPNVPVNGDCGWGCGTATVSTITIPPGITSIADIRCSVFIQGAGGFSSVVPELTSPSGQTVTLANFNCPGTSSQPTINVTFGQSPNAYSAANLNAGWTYVMDSCFPPGPSMDVFDGLDPTGTWTLSVYREFQSPGATLVEWELTVSDGQIGQTPAPGNDDCTASIAVIDGSVTTFDMTSATASGVVDCLGAAAEDIWYEFTADCVGDYTFSSAGSSFATVVSLFPAVNCPAPGAAAMNCAPGQVTVALLAGETIRVRVSPDVGATLGAGEIAVTSSTTPLNDDCGVPTPLVPISGSLQFDSTCATEGFTQTCSAGPASTFALHDVWYSFTADCDGTLTLDTFGSGFDTAIAVWPGLACPTGPAPFCNDDATNAPAGQSSRSSLTIPNVVAGEEYLIQIGGGVLGERGAGVLNVTWVCDPSIVLFQRGNCNNDASINIADAIYTLTFLFPLPGDPPITLACSDACDANDDGLLNIADAIAALNVLFPAVGTTPEFPPPAGACGDDPTADTLDCPAYDEADGCPP